MRSFNHRFSSQTQSITARITVFEKENEAVAYLNKKWKTVVGVGGSAFLRDIPAIDDGDGGILPATRDISDAEVQFGSAEVWEVDTTSALSLTPFIVSDLFDSQRHYRFDREELNSSLVELHDLCPFSYYQVGSGRIILQPLPNGASFTKDLIKATMRINEKLFRSDYSDPEHRGDLTNFFKKQFLLIGFTDSE